MPDASTAEVRRKLRRFIGPEAPGASGASAFGGDVGSVMRAFPCISIQGRLSVWQGFYGSGDIGLRCPGRRPGGRNRFAEARASAKRQGAAERGADSAARPPCCPGRTFWAALESVRGCGAWAGSGMRCWRGIGPGAERVRARRRLAGGEGRRVRIVAGDTGLAVDRTGLLVPITAGAPVDAGLPIAVRGAVTAPAERRAFRQLQFAPIARLQQVQIRFVMAIETNVVPIMPSVAHDDVGVLLGNHQVVVGIEAQGRGLALLLAAVAVEV